MQVSKGLFLATGVALGLGIVYGGESVSADTIQGNQYLTEAQLTDKQGNIIDQSGVNETFTVNYKWALPDSVEFKKDDVLRINNPKQITSVKDQEFTVKEQGQDSGTAQTVGQGQETKSYVDVKASDYYEKNPENKMGDLSFTGKWNREATNIKGVDNSDGQNQIDFNAPQVDQQPVIVNGVEKNDNEKFLKFGYVLSNGNIQWKERVNKGGFIMQNPNVTDEVAAGQEIIPGTLSVETGTYDDTDPNNTQFNSDGSDQSATVKSQNENGFTISLPNLNQNSAFIQYQTKVTNKSEDNVYKNKATLSYMTGERANSEEQNAEVHSQDASGSGKGDNTPKKPSKHKESEIIAKEDNNPATPSEETPSTEDKHSGENTGDTDTSGPQEEKQSETGNDSGSEVPSDNKSSDNQETPATKDTDKSEPQEEKQAETGKETTPEKQPKNENPSTPVTDPNEFKEGDTEDRQPQVEPEPETPSVPKTEDTHSDGEQKAEEPSKETTPEDPDMSKYIGHDKDGNEYVIHPEDHVTPPTDGGASIPDYVLHPTIDPEGQQVIGEGQTSDDPDTWIKPKPNNEAPKTEETKSPVVTPQKPEVATPKQEEPKTKSVVKSEQKKEVTKATVAPKMTTVTLPTPQPASVATAYTEPAKPTQAPAKQDQPAVAKQGQLTALPNTGEAEDQAQRIGIVGSVLAFIGLAGFGFRKLRK